MASIDTKRRVKFYVLNDARQWVDRGTGHVSWIYNDRQRSVSLVVKSEIDGSVLLDAKIMLSIVYQRQQDTLIVWSDTDKRDLALSFQEKAGCDEIWEKICEVLGEDPTSTMTSSRGTSSSLVDNSNLDDQSDDDQLENDYLNSANQSPTSSDLPQCELSKLKDIRDFFVCDLPRKSKQYKEKLTTILETDAYIKKLIELFQMCEDLENVEGLNYLFEIFRSLFYLNKSSLLDILLSDEMIMDVIGCLEYDPSKTEPSRHREYINTKSQFKEIIPFDNLDLVQKIHQTYKVQYIQDVILPAPSVFEENSLASLTSFIFLNKVEISNLIQDDDRFLNELFENLKSAELPLDKRRDMILFLREFIGFLHSLQQTREPYFRSLSEHGLLTVLEASLNVKDDKINQASIDILSQFVEVSPTLVREFILNEIESKSSVNYLNSSLSLNKSNLSSTSASSSNNSSTMDTSIKTPVPNNLNNNNNHANLSETPTLINNESNHISSSVNKNSNQILSLADILNTDDVFEPIIINYVIRQMINDPDPELSGAMQITNLLKLLIDPENMLSAANKAEKSEFLAYFYRKSMSILIAPLLANTANNRINREDYRIAQLQNLIIDFLSFCAEHHTYHIKNYIINRDLLKRILVLLKSKHQFLALSALRFLRKTLSLKEETYNKYIVKANLFEPVVEALKTNASRYNILNSAIIELFDFIRLDDIKSLMVYLVENFYPQLEEFNYVRTFRDLKLRYEQHKEKLNDLASNRIRLNSEGTPTLYRTRTSSDRYLRAQDRIDFDEKEDEAWIEEDDEDLETRINDQSNHSNLLSSNLDNPSSSSSSSSSSCSSSSCNSNPNSNSNDEPPLSSSSEPSTTASTTSQSTSNFIEYNKKIEENEDTIFSPVKSTTTIISSSSNKINIKIGASVTVNAIKNNQESNISNNSLSPKSPNTNSPSNSNGSKKLVDYEYDSDEEELEEENEEDLDENSNKSIENVNNINNSNNNKKFEEEKAEEEEDEGEESKPQINDITNQADINNYNNLNSNSNNINKKMLDVENHKNHLNHSEQEVEEESLERNDETANTLHDNKPEEEEHQVSNQETNNTQQAIETTESMINCETTNEIIAKSKSSLSPLTSGLSCSMEPATKRARLSNS